MKFALFACYYSSLSTMSNADVLLGDSKLCSLFSFDVACCVYTRQRSERLLVDTHCRNRFVVSQKILFTRF